MGIDYINANFTGLDDLASVSSKLDHLNKLRDSIKNAVDVKVGDTESASTSSFSVDSEKLNSSIDKIISVLDYSSETTDLADALANIDALILEFGSLDFLTKLRNQLAEKISVQKSIKLLHEANDVHQQLTSALSITELADIAKKVKLSIPVDDPVSDQLLEILNTKVETLVSEKRNSIQPKFSKLLHDSNWLQSNSDVSTIPSATLNAINRYVNDLVDLQSILDPPSYPSTWWALDILLEPIITRFNYHFNTPHMETNKISKPEWALDFIEKFLSDNLALLNLVVEHIFKLCHRIATFEIITTLLNPLREKILSSIKVLNANIDKYSEQPVNLEKSGRLLSHLIFELSSFDQRLRNIYKYNPYIENLAQAPSKKWTGLTGDVMLRGNDESLAVTNWLNFEKQLANKRFNSEILNSDDAFRIDFDYQGSFDEDNSEVVKNVIKPTYSAYAIVKLFDNLSSHFQTLSIVKYQLKYVSSIQLDLLDKYFERLDKMRKEFNNSFNQKAMLNLIPGGLNEKNVREVNTDTVKLGMANLQTISELFCSAKFISNALEQWSEELIFIQLWEAFKSVSKDAGLSIFDGTIRQYDSLVEKSLVLYEEFFRKEIRTSLKNYVNSSQWNISSNEAPEVPQELIVLGNNLLTYLDYVKRTMSKLDYFLVSDRVVSLISIILTEYIVTNNQFSKDGAAQLKFDFEYIVSELRDSLYLEGDKTELSNSSNHDFLRLSQSVEFLSKLDAATAKQYQRKQEQFQELRDQFADGLEALSNHNIGDLLLRIV
ncbi:hypothetical protein G9P44_000916 [Scheffersomyces stipitis]|nr:hypothetical protein G9P44_000916 [Scheffersomyces stipitis]